MLHLPAPFPQPGSIAVFQGARWRIRQVMAGGLALIMRDGTGASATRREPLADLVDARLADENEALALTDVGASTARIAIHAAALLRDRNSIALRDLGQMLTAAAQAGRIPAYLDNSHLARIMRRLGWRKNGYAGEGYDRSPVYVRQTKGPRA